MNDYTESEKQAARLALEKVLQAWECNGPSGDFGQNLVAAIAALAPAEPEPDELSVNTDDFDRRAHFDLDTSGWNDPLASKDHGEARAALPEVPPMPSLREHDGPRSCCSEADVRALHAFATEMAQEVARLREPDKEKK